MKNLVLKEKFGCSKKNLDAQRKIWMLKEKFGINYASAEAQFGTGRGIIQNRSWFFFTKNFFIDAPAKAAEILAETVTEAWGRHPQGRGKEMSLSCDKGDYCKLPKSDPNAV